MAKTFVATPERMWMPRAQLDGLIKLLRGDGRRVIGPTVRDSAIVYEDIDSAGDLPIGYSDEQAPGRYRIAKDGDGGHAFDFASSPTSWKAFTFPSLVPLGRSRRDGDGIEYVPLEPETGPMAFIGVRACDIAAMATHDRVLTGGPFVDGDYGVRRDNALIIAVECGTPSGTCFCSSMETGPEVTSGFDLALTEIDDGYVVRAGSDVGMDLIARLALEPAQALRQDAADRVPLRARATMGRHAGVATDGLGDRLMAQLQGPGWERVAERCLACTNCTMACPTCFCTSVTRTSDLLGHETVEQREWDSCFTLDFARVAGGNFRPKVADRYRQWLTHKFSTWIDQFGTSGCVGCGRCITWCPVGIDVREELAFIAPAPAQPAAPQAAP